MELKSPEERAQAEALDYAEIYPKELKCKNNTICHIIGGIFLAFLFVVIATVGIVILN